ncbi:Clathrin light chain [Saxophila tyrrhenica]|uniref:Clathrin light chain n=1 Tax=Saxophila tyrrhenica TaxID=1690608 RepID=A0AAV9PAN5_9PEZI|nr:Clathrin light chain [Saxophila tyrrhenica]
MADRFPSLDDFDAGQTEVSGQPSASADEPSDFLARERAALGEDAQQFAGSGDNMATVADAEEDDDDLLGGGGGGSQPIADMDMMGDFETSFPSVETGNEGVAPGGTITGSTLPYRAPDSSAYAQEEEEPEVVREWRERRNMAIESLDERSASKKAETVKAAQEAIDEFYENYNNRKDKQVAQTRKEAEEFLKNREDTTSGGTSWERIAKLVDLSGKGAGGGASGTAKARMREVLLDLRKDKDAPGAGGV